MKEDLIEKEIKRFGLMLQKLSGLVLTNDLDKVQDVIKDNYDGQLIDDFINGEEDYSGQPFRYKQLQFQVDLLYYEVLTQHRKGRADEEQKKKYLIAAQKLQLNNQNLFDYTLKMKIDEVAGM